MQVVDPHVHFWDADALSYSWLHRAQPAFAGVMADLPRRYLPADLRADAGADIDVLKVVHFGGAKVRTAIMVVILRPQPGRTFTATAWSNAVR